ncbi:hypothetical protein ACRYCC_40900 [Actinomadura scrupuli]|uniref:hypothetical protein n=1 Tax=Actinomadura scrupuli TaxID=559629 RepID=UPI003D9994E7
MKPIFRRGRLLVPALTAAVLAAAPMSAGVPARAAQPPRAQAAGVSLAYAAPEIAASRGRVVWRWTLTNTQPQAVGNVVLTHTLTPAVAVTSASAPCTTAASVVRCQFASLAAGEVRQGVIETVVPTGQVRVSGGATWTEPAPPAPAPAPVAGGPAGIRLVFGAPEIAASRGRVVWRWTLTNAQSHAVGNVVLTHTLTPAVAVTSASAPCTTAASVVRCQFASLAAGEVRQGVFETVVPTVPVQVSGQVAAVAPTARAAGSATAGVSAVAGTSAGAGRSTVASTSTASVRPHSRRT